jgi:hypothetical protein
VNQNYHNLGDVHLENDHGMIWLMRADTIGCDKIFCNRETLSLATLSSSAPVYYDGKIIGAFHSKQYNKLDGFLVAFFKLDVSRDSLPSADCLYAIPRYDTKVIQCIGCERVFAVGSVACDCIEHAPAIQIPKIQLTGVSIHDGMNEDVTMLDSRAALLKLYFGGIIAMINTDNEEF